MQNTTRRGFLFRALTTGAGVFLSGCKGAKELLGPRSSTTDPSGYKYEQVGDGGGSSSATVRLIVRHPNGVWEKTLSIVAGARVGDVLALAERRGLSVIFGAHPTRGRYVTELQGHTVDSDDVPTWLYAISPAPILPEDDAGFDLAKASAYVDQILVLDGQCIEWRLAIP